MRRLLLCLLTVGLLAGENGEQAFQDGDVVGFCGDSITHAEYSEINYTHVLYDYYVTHMPEEEIELRNLGVGGARIPDGLELYEKDPAASGLDTVVLEYGINDLKKYFYENPEAYEENREAREGNLEEYKENLNVFLDKLEGDGIEKEEIYTTTLAIPGVISKEDEEQGDSQSLTEEGFRRLSEVSRELAEEQGIGLIEFQEPLTDLAKTMPGEEIMRTDWLHLNTNGQIYLAYLFLEQQGALRDVSRVEIQQGEIRSEDARVSNLHYKEGYLYYDYQPKRLPMGLSDEYREADACLHILDKLNREIIQVKDLDADIVYDIYINGNLLGSYRGAEFVEGVNIANLGENPAQRFAAIIEQMNRGRRVAELAYRKKVQDFTTCGSGSVTEEELLEAYQVWQEKDATYRRSMYDLAQEEIQVTERVAIVQQGVEAPKAAFSIPGKDYKKGVIVLVPMIGFMGGGMLYRKKRKQKS